MSDVNIYIYHTQVYIKRNYKNIFAPTIQNFVVLTYINKLGFE